MFAYMNTAWGWVVLGGIAPAVAALAVAFILLTRTPRDRP
jgi:hypothetical protein